MNHECWIHEMIVYKIGSTKKGDLEKNMIDIIINDDKQIQGHDAIILIFVLSLWNSIFM